jgi:hypothetical protein
MRLNCGKDNGVRLAGRTLQDIARIARTAMNVVICRSFLRAIGIPTATATTARGSSAWK